MTKKYLINILKAIVPKKYVKKIKELILLVNDGYSAKSYSQEGEDMVLRKIFEGVKNGYYVDVGAHHPKRFSNTYYFYKRGWSGINIDAMPGSMKLFKKARPRDINIEAAIANGKKKMVYYIFNEPAFNTLSEDMISKRVNDNTYVIDKMNIESKRLKDILLEYLPENKKINFMSIDVEGLDLEVIKSNDWQIFRPEYILIESCGLNIEEVLKSDLYKIVNKEGYVLFAKMYFSVIFKSII